MTLSNQTSRCICNCIRIIGKMSALSSTNKSHTDEVCQSFSAQLYVETQSCQYNGCRDKVVFNIVFFAALVENSEYDEKIPYSQTVDNSASPRGRATRQS